MHRYHVGFGSPSRKNSGNDSQLPPASNVVLLERSDPFAFRTHREPPLSRQKFIAFNLLHSLFIHTIIETILRQNVTEIENRAPRHNKHRLRQSQRRQWEGDCEN